MEKNLFTAPSIESETIEKLTAQLLVANTELQKMQRDREESKAALAKLQAMVAESEARMPSVEEERRNRLTRNCPRCGHKSGHPINEFEKKASIGFWGFASSKWGKSYKCDACGYMW